MPKRFYPGEVVHFEWPDRYQAAVWGHVNEFIVTDEAPMPGYDYRIYHAYDRTHSTFSVRHNELELIEND
jgi:hypothetical protein